PGKSTSGPRQRRHHAGQRFAVEDVAQLRDELEGSLYPEAEVSGNSRWHVQEDVLMLELVEVQPALQHAGQDVQMAALAAADEQPLEFTDGKVLEVRQHAGGFQQPLVGPEDVADQGQGKIVERQAGDHVVVDALAGQVLQRRVDQVGLVP